MASYIRRAEFRGGVRARAGNILGLTWFRSDQSPRPAMQDADLKRLLRDKALAIPEHQSGLWGWVHVTWHET